ncbi:sugar kinase-like protein [Haloterrigena turkmenica DSM 5511]|uniref:Sugar kinase-like protein n=1 Tax=Haloterrigena turkmenica (strain ATCC 51198 / DSM 5511 / JCM 9101 / NCIMB 13204 / VKM B-1734 / 4k) TaxID=543526 RepID=D2RZ60_HALTV|nr:NAD(+)/NADH kinase [Haloterrigena turkmenica]ADB59984.1 sugar kinase-like protein [Haloterrigena turkmenica DSM 5511]
MDAAWFVDEEPVVGIVDANADTGSRADADESLADALRPTVAGRDATAVSGDVDDVLAAAPSVLVAAGDDCLSAIARADADGPVLPVGDVTGIDAVDRARVPAALEAVLDGAATVRRHAILDLEIAARGGSIDAAGYDGVDVDIGSDSDAGGTGTDAGSADTDGNGADTDASDGDAGADAVRDRALFDVTLVTDEPARISEYGVASRGDSVATFRADGVVVATAAGSHGYAGAVDAPHLSRAVDAVAVAPVAPFVTDTRRWVLPDDRLELTVERDEGPIALVADGRRVTSVGVDARIAVSVADALETLSVPDGALEGR